MPDVSLRDLPLVDARDERELDREVTGGEIVGAAVGWIVATLAMLPVDVAGAVARNTLGWAVGLAAVVAGKLAVAWVLVVVASNWRRIDADSSTDNTS